MKIKVFTPNHNGKIEFTRAELEKLLNEVYSDGYKEGEYDANSRNWTWTSPSLTTPYCTIAATIDAADSINGTTHIVNNLICDKTMSTAPIKDYTVTLSSNNIAKDISKAINEIAAKAESVGRVGRAANRPLNVFDTLAKELNF